MNPTASPAVPARLVTIVLATLAMIASMLFGALPARAATYTVTFSPPAGTVGTSVPLTSTVTSGALGVGAGTVSYFASGAQVAQAPVDATGVVGAASWTPVKAGSIPMFATYVSSDGTQTATSTVAAATIAKATTTTTLTVPAAAKTGAVVAVSTTVTAGTYVPTGSVTFQQGNGTILAAVPLDASGKASLNVQMPAQPTAYSVKAVYNGDDNAKTSTSTTETIQVTTSGSVVDLAVSAGPYFLGTPLTLTATVNVTPANGSVTFTAGSTVIGAQQVANGTAAITFAPTAAGAVTLTASFIPNGQATALGSGTQQITVASNQQAAVITLGPSGQAPWAAGQTVPLRFQQTLILSASSSTGAAVSLTVAGPCAVNGSTVTANAGAGTCTLTATVPATAQFLGATRTNTLALALGQQTATLIAPASKKLPRRTVVVLAQPGTRTNAGNTVAWKVISGASRCKISRPADGRVLLRTVKKGSCTVRASAPAVAGQWQAFKRAFPYKVR